MKDVRTSPRLEAIGRWLCICAALLGALGVVGWITGAHVLVQPIPTHAPMMPNTVLCLVLVGGAGWLLGRPGRWRRVAALLAATVVLAVGLATLFEYAFAVDLGIDELLVRTGTTPHPGRMSPPTALALALVAAAVLLADVRPVSRLRPAEWLAMGSWLVAFTAVLGQIFGAGPLYPIEDAPVRSVGATAALGLLLASTGLLLERPDAGLMRIATSSGPGGVLLRRLTIIAIIAPVIANLTLSRLLDFYGLHQPPFVYAALAMAATVLAIVVLTATAIPLERVHEALLTSRERTRTLVEQAPDAIFVADAQGRYVEVNGTAARLSGYTQDELLQRSIVDLLPPDELERFDAHRVRVLAGETEVGEWKLRRKDGTLVPVEVSAKFIADGRWQAFVRDITERKRAESQLRQAAERLELALRGADLAAWDWNVATGEAAFNDRWAEMRGFRLDEIEQHVETWIAGMHPDDWPLVQRRLADHFAGRTPEYDAEHRVRTKRGEWIWILDRGRVFARDDQGRPTRMVGTELDITERRRDEEALRLSEAKFSGIVSISADAIVSIDEEQRITLFNEGAEKIFGWSSREAIGAPLEILIPERFREIHREHVRAFAAEPGASRPAGGHRRAILGLRRNGEEFPAAGSISKLDVAGTRLYTASLRDVGEERRRERETEFLADLAAALASTVDVDEGVRRFCRLAAESLADACMVHLVAGSEDPLHVCVMARDPSHASTCELLERLHRLDVPGPSLVASAVLSRRPSLVTIASPEDLAAFAATDEYGDALRRLDPRYVLTAPLVVRGELLGAIALVVSTSSRVDRDLQFVQEVAERFALSVQNARLHRAAQRAIAAREDVLGVVAHDLRNPLSVILLQATLLSHGSPRDSGPGRAGETIERAATRMKRLIEDLLEITCMEAGRLELDRSRVSPAQVVTEFVETQRTLAASHSLELRTELAAPLPDISADRDRLLQVLENLVGNAVKFTDPGGCIVVGAAPQERDVLFWVSDTGAGIATKDLPHLFDRFWQSRKARQAGAGLGLPIVKGLVDAHGGRVWVESSPGRGTTFFFTVPRLEPGQHRRAEPARPTGA